MIRLQPKILTLGITGATVIPVHGYPSLQGTYELKDGLSAVAKGTHREWSTATREALQRLLTSMEEDLAQAYGVVPEPEYEADRNAYGRPPEKEPTPPPVESDLSSHLDDEPSPF